MVVVAIFLNFCSLYNSEPPLVSEKNEEVTENRKVRKIVWIFLRRIVKFVIAWNPGHKWEIKPKERPGPSKIGVVN